MRVAEMNERARQVADPVDTIVALFATKGDTAYFGEDVSQRAHALQAAHLAVRNGASDALVVAALLHDIGHLLHDEDENIADAGVDTHHEEVGDHWLARWFGPEVTEPVRLHVTAKRYLCAVDPAYLAHLSPASRQSLQLQGGPMSPDEVRTFEANPYYADAVRLRRWDDEAKIVGWDVPDVAFYRAQLEGVLKSA